MDTFYWTPYVGIWISMMNRISTNKFDFNFCQLLRSLTYHVWMYCSSNVQCQQILLEIKRSCFAAKSNQSLYENHILFYELNLTPYTYLRWKKYHFICFWPTLHTQIRNVVVCMITQVWTNMHSRLFLDLYQNIVRRLKTSFPADVHNL